MAWKDFIELAQADAEANDDRASYARNMLTAMRKYLLCRYSIEDILALGNVVEDQDVTDAIKQNISALTIAEHAVVTAVAQVIKAMAPPIEVIDPAPIEVVDPAPTEEPLSPPAEVIDPTPVEVVPEEVPLEVPNV